MDPIITAIIMKPDIAYFPFPQPDFGWAHRNESITHTELTEKGHPSFHPLDFTSPRQTVPPQAAPANGQVKEQV